MINPQEISNLPSGPGIYIFKNETEILYIGKSINIKARVKTHIENAKSIYKEKLITQKSTKIDYINTDSDFNAILLESQLIQNYQPKYNAVLKDNKSVLYIEITVNDKYPKVLLSRRQNISKNNVYYGPFQSVRIAEIIIAEIRKIVPFCTQRNLTKHPCFYSKINLCKPCPNYIEHGNIDDIEKSRLLNIYKSNIRSVISILKGGASKLIKKYYIQLKKMSRQENYEQAINIRNTIRKLEYLLFEQSFYKGEIVLQFNQTEKAILSLVDILGKRLDVENLTRIECYDVSNINHDFATASMVVFTNGMIDRGEYRKFRIKNKLLKSDFDMLGEVIVRRFKNNWKRPNLIVVDGGKPQIRKLSLIFDELGISIPFIGLAKRPDRIVIGKNKMLTIYLDNNSLALNLLRRIRDESHRFAKKYHLFIRDSRFLL